MIESVKSYPWSNPVNTKGLDYGCGPTNVMSELLKQHSFAVDDYDPNFFNHPLEKQYDFIICHEVCEHFENPQQDFNHIKELLNPNGVLFLRTRLYQPNQVFSQWSYARDKTHVCFYNEATIDWLKTQFANLVFVNG
jgi:SAM-dependent methyltransferase